MDEWLDGRRDVAWNGDLCGRAGPYSRRDCQDSQKMNQHPALPRSELNQERILYGPYF
ncbi:MAG: hypothetical protein ACI8UO_006093 [Verrucomicrobiales bacterium]|jgi:hypothetical protein